MYCLVDYQIALNKNQLTKMNINKTINTNTINKILRGIESTMNNLPAGNIAEAIASVFTIVGFGVTAGTTMYVSNRALTTMFGFPREYFLSTILRSTQRSTRNEKGLKLKTPDIHAFSGKESDWIKWSANT